MLIVKIITNNTMYNAQELHLFSCLFSSWTNVIPAIFSSSTFPVYFQLIYPLKFFYTYSFVSLNTPQDHMIYGIHICNYSDS